MRPLTLFVFVLLICYGNHSLIAQPTGTSQVINTLTEAYRQFDYATTDRILNDALAGIETYSYEDRIIIFQYQAIREVEKGRPLSAKDFFWKILEIDPTYAPDPLTVSPKISTLFQSTKIDYITSLDDRYSQIEKNFHYNPVPWRSLIFPGWEQLHRGYSLKGGIFAGAGIAGIAGLIQSVIHTRSAYDDYRNAVAPDDITHRYDTYNRLYKSQFYWSYACLAIWITSHLDALFFCPVQSPLRLTWQHDQNVTSFTLTYPL